MGRNRCARCFKVASRLQSFPNDNVKFCVPCFTVATQDAMETASDLMLDEAM